MTPEEERATRAIRNLLRLWVEADLPLVPENSELCRALARAALSPPAPAIDAAHIEHQREWSRQTFGPQTPLGVADHIRKELVEAEDDPTEWVDVIILAIDGACRAGLASQEIIDAVKAKQAANEAREWPDWRTLSPDKAVEHVRAQRAAMDVLATTNAECAIAEPPKVTDLMAALQESVAAAKEARKHHPRPIAGDGGPSDAAH